MIQILNKQDCCGCSACAQRCPKQCITMELDEEGFLYPQVNLSLCINCGICEKVCPVIVKNDTKAPKTVYAALNNDEQIRLQSSSGGVFSILAENIIDGGGVVFGARWNDNWEVVHDFTETKEGLSLFRSSKYLQSVIGNSFIDVEKFLRQGRNVLFSGTPCQIAGLKKFLRKDYSNLLTVEVFCHSVPSPQVWNSYLNDLLLRLKWEKSDLININFRSKIFGWKQYHFRIERKDGIVFDELASKNFYMRGFIKGLYTRPSCFACPAKKFRSGSDISIGDFWGIQKINPQLDDDKGLSAIVVNTPKGQDYLNKIKLSLSEMKLSDICLYNPALVHNAVQSKERDYFYVHSEMSFADKVSKLCEEPLLWKIKHIVYIVFKYFQNTLKKYFKI